MNMDFDIFTIDTKEPVIAQWALRRIENIHKTDENQACGMEARLFTDDVIEKLLEHQEIPFLLSTMLRVLSPVKFRHFMPQLIEIWKKGQDEISVKRIGRIIAENDSEKAFGLFEDFCRQGDIAFQDSEKWTGVCNGLSYLNVDHQKHMANLMIDACLNADPGEEITWNDPSIMALMWQYQHPCFENVLRSYIRRMSSKDSEQSYAWRLRPIIELLDLSVSEYSLIVDLLEGYPAPWPSEIKEFYQPSVSPQEIDNAIRDIKKRSYKSIHRFLLTNLLLIADDRVKQLWQSLLNDGKFISDLHKKKQRPYFYAMLLCALTSALRVTSLSLETLSMECAALLLSAHVEEVPDMPAFVSYFKNKDQAAAVACLTEALDQVIVSETGNHVLTVIAGLDYDEFIEPLARAICTENISDHAFEHVFDILVRYGERAIGFIDICFSGLNPFGQMTLLEIISGIGGKKAVAFLEKHFDACMALNREQTLSACEDLACGFCLDRIRPKINKGQTDIDNAYMTISLLKQERTPEVETLLTAYYQRSQDQARIMDTFESGDILGTFKPYMDVELKCGQCGDVNTYRVNRVIADKTQENYIAQEIECISCGQMPEFEVPQSGNMKIAAEMMRLTFLNSEQDIAKAIDVSPIEMTRFSAFGKEMGVRQAIETYKQRIEEEPDNAEYHIGLGNTYFYLDKWTAAAPYFERSITLNPDYIEAYYALAEIAEAKNDPDKALAWLKKGVPRLRAMKFMKYSRIDPIEFEDEYIGFYNELLVRTGGPESDYMKTLDLPPGYYAPPPKPFIREDKKIGRNDPCPCGSGKKYKKCCLNKS